MVIFDALQSVFTIFIMMGLGFYLTRKQWFNNEVSNLFSKLVIKISLPAFMISNVVTNFSKETLSKSLIGLLVPLATMLINYLLSFIFIKLLKIDKNKRGTFSVMFSLSNTIFLGVPICTSLFGENVITYVLLYYIINTLTFWTIGVYGIKKDGGFLTNSFINKDNLKNIFSPPLVAFIFSMFCVLLNIKLPKAVLDSCKYMGNLTTPLSTLFMGITLSELKLKDLKLDLSTLVILIGRFIISPLIMISLLQFVDLPLLMKKVFIIEAALPVMTQVAIVSKNYNGDYKYATAISTLSTAFSLIFIPIYMILFTYM